MSRRDHKKAEDTKIVLPITPMLDMTFQLLFFFIVSFNPADLEGAVDTSLPSDHANDAHTKAAQPRHPQPFQTHPTVPARLAPQVRMPHVAEVNLEVRA